MTEEMLLAQARQLPAAQRAAFLERECPDPDLRTRVLVLLAAEADREAAEPALPSEASTGPLRTIYAAVGDRIGPYKLLEAIGEGGMGEVWMAQQDEPVKRRVALKLIKPGMDSRAVLARFEAERQALALMDHPNIAKVFDAGATADGRPYFVMELVKGVPITKYCDQKRLTPRERLELFVQACQAIQHAHQKGIIHRDIKPSNVLVALYDDKPVVKVIDFGVAKATGQPLTDKTLATGLNAVVGTPQYMSPEQATLNNLDIDTRSDVYSLGVLLYELLVGSPPFSRKELQEKGLMEILRVVREEEPPRPSTKLSTADALPTLSANRNTEPKRLTALLRGELDWIVMKALEKDRTRRYATANGFAADVQRYLAGEPVLAHPPSTAYRLKKFLRKNRGPVLAVSVVFVALAVGIVGTTLGLLEARRQAAIAEEQRTAAEAAAEKERLAKQEAEGQRQKAEAAAEKERLARQEAADRLTQIELINNSVFDIFTDFDIRKVKAGPDPVEYVLTDRLIAAGKKLDERAIHDPLVLANLRDRLGQTLLSLGRAKEAIEFLTWARDMRQAKLGADHPATLNSMGNLALGYKAAGQLAQALPLYEVTLKLMKAKLGPDHPDTLTSMNNLAAGYGAAGQLAQALPLYEETLKLTKAKLGPDHPDTLNSMNNLAGGYQAAGQLAKALPLYEETLKLRKAKLGPDHPDTLTSMNNLALGYKAAGQLAKALPLYEETLKLMKAKLGPDHPHTLTSMNNLALGYKAAGQLAKALPLYEETLKLMKAKLGPDHPHTLSSMNNLALGYQAAGQLDKALPLLEETLKLRKAKLGPDHPATLNSMAGLAAGYYAAGQLAKALPLYEETLKLRKAKLGADHPDTLGSMGNLAVGYRDAGQLAKALPLYEETLKLRKAKLGADHPDTLNSMGNLGKAYCDAKQGEKAAPLLKDFVAGQRKRFSKNDPRFAGLLAQVARDLLKCDQFATAEEMLRECLAIREKKPGSDDPLSGWLVFNTMSQLGGALLGQKKYAEAEPLLLKGYEGMKAREKTIPPQAAVRIPEALDRLIELYTKWDKPDEAKKWQAVKDKLPQPPAAKEPQKK